MVILLLIILLIVVGNKVIYKDNFAIVTGTISLNNGSGIAYLNYPNGYNYSNCIVVAASIAIHDNSTFNFFGDDTTSSIFSVRLQASNIRLGSKSIDNVGTSSTKNCMVVLMKK